jgi:twitching motility two-component system response regulator PilG
MRLEIDTTVSAPPLTDEHLDRSRGEVDSAEVKSALNQGIKAAQAGNRTQARTSLMRATELDPRSESAWLWLASISEYPEELLGFLNHVLEINPENQRALEWKAATHSLLSKTFVQRGIDAAQESKKDFANECFQTALEYDERNATAWMWMASLSNDVGVKISLLEKALAIEPQNESALAAIDEAKKGIFKARMTEAKTAAVAGNNAEAIDIIDSLLAVDPRAVEAWTMRSHLSEGFDDKIRCFENILAIEPDNIAAKSGRDSLLAIFGTAEAAHAEEENQADEDATEFAGEVTFVAPSFEEPVDKSPTEDLEMPVGVAVEPDPSEAQIYPANPQEHEHERMEAVAEPFASFAEETPEPFETTAVSEPVGELVQDVEPSIEATAVEEHVTFEAPVQQEVVEDEHVYADPQAETVVFSYQGEPEPPVDNEPEPWSEPLSDPAIAMPFEELPATPAPVSEPEPVAEPDHAAAAEQIDAEAEEEVLAVKALSFDCPFCGQRNDAQAITCQSCLAVLTLSDLELLLANHDADKLRLRQSVEEMERQRLSREFQPDELVTLGLGHLNLRNLQLGYVCLSEASRLSPNNVVLGSQVNSLLIRLEEIKQQQEAQLRMPKGKSILVVDDSPTVRKLIAGKLEKCGHDVICASDGVEAMERLANFVPDLILLDITMPRMDGYQVCKQIRSNSATKDIAVVMISGKDGFFDKVRGRMAGTTGYITKPFGPETLMKAVEMYLSGEAPELDDEEA